MAKELVYTVEEVRHWLENHLPARQVHKGRLARTYRPGDRSRTMLVAQDIAFLGETAWHHPDLTLDYSSVQLRLMTYSADGITGKALELAQRIEELVTWKPGERSALTGPPEPHKIIGPYWGLRLLLTRNRASAPGRVARCPRFTAPVRQAALHWSSWCQGYRALFPGWRCGASCG